MMDEQYDKLIRIDGVAYVKHSTLMDAIRFISDKGLYAEFLLSLGEIEQSEVEETEGFDIICKKCGSKDCEISVYKDDILRSGIGFDITCNSCGYEE